MEVLGYLINSNKNYIDILRNISEKYHIKIQIKQYDNMRKVLEELFKFYIEDEQMLNIIKTIEFIDDLEGTANKCSRYSIIKKGGLRAYHSKDELKGLIADDLEILMKGKEIKTPEIKVQAEENATKKVLKSLERSIYDYAREAGLEVIRN